MKKLIISGSLVILAAGCGAKTPTAPAVPTPLQISDWAVEFTPTQGIGDIRYAIDPNHLDTADFSSASLVSLDQQTGGDKCAIADAPLGTLSRVVNFDAFTAAGHALPRYVLLGQYYYYYSPPQSPCSSNQAVQNMQTLQAGNLTSSMDSLQIIPKSQ